MATDSKKQARLSAVQDYLDELYCGGTLLRYDLLSRKVQTSLTSSSWRDITDRDINSITREVSIRSGQNISAQLQSKLFTEEPQQQPSPAKSENPSIDEPLIF